MSRLRSIGVVALLLLAAISFAWAGWFILELSEPCTPLWASERESVPNGSTIYEYESLSEHRQRLVDDAIAGLNDDGTATYWDSDSELDGAIVVKNGTNYEVWEVADACRTDFGTATMLLLLMAGGGLVWSALSLRRGTLFCRNRLAD